MTLAEATDLYLGDVARKNTPATVRKYRQILGYLLEDLHWKPLEEITQDDIEKWLNHWQGKSKTTMALHISIAKCFFRFLARRGTIPVSPAENIDRPRLAKPEDRDVVTVSWQDVEKMLQKCETWGETITFGLLIYLGPRRSALAKLRWKDVDLENQRIRFYEKGSKTAVKVMPKGLVDLFVQYLGVLTEDGKAYGVMGAGSHGLPVTTLSDGARGLSAEPSSVSTPNPEDYVIPNDHPGKVQRKERDGRIVWNIVKRVGKRAGIQVTTHSLRAAFAVHYLEMNPGQLKSLQAFLGHDRIDTTQIYLRKLDREKSMEVSKDLDWGVRFGALTEGEAGLRLKGIATPSRSAVAPQTPSASALTEGVSRISPKNLGPMAREAPEVRPPSVSALTEGERTGQGGPVGGKAGRALSHSSSVSALTEGSRRFGRGLEPTAGSPLADWSLPSVSALTTGEPSTSICGSPVVSASSDTPSRPGARSTCAEAHTGIYPAGQRESRPRTQESVPPGGVAPTTDGALVEGVLRQCHEALREQPSHAPSASASSNSGLTGEEDVEVAPLLDGATARNSALGASRSSSAVSPSRQNVISVSPKASPVFPSGVEEAHTGFEPVFPENVDSERPGRKRTVRGV